MHHAQKKERNGEMGKLATGMSVPRRTKWSKKANADANATRAQSKKGNIDFETSNIETTNQSINQSINVRQVHKLLALVPYLDWVMILVTTTSSISMLFETPRDRVVENPLLQIAEYVFVLFMTAEMFFKLCSNGLFLTPQAMVRYACVRTCVWLLVLA